MSRPLIRIHNAETDEVIDREMTDEEFEQYEKDQLAEVERQADLDAKAQARQAILDRLGLTEEEARLLLG